MHLIAALTIFLLAAYLGAELVGKIPPALHLPFLSGSGAIAGISLVGAMSLGGLHSRSATILGVLAVIFATVNVVGGFTSARRMLLAFKDKKDSTR